jgi:hypothetical protein
LTIKSKSKNKIIGQDKVYEWPKLDGEFFKEVGVLKQKM